MHHSRNTVNIPCSAERFEGSPTAVTKKQREKIEQHEKVNCVTPINDPTTQPVPSKDLDKYGC